MSGSAFVQDEFAVPDRLVADRFVLEPLGPQHSEADYAAWTSSVEHIRTTPGWRGTSWPVEMTPQQNTDDLIRHQEDFAARRGFTYTVLDPGDRQVIGCVYLYPPRRPGTDVQVHSWARADRADLDVPLWQAVTDWLRDQWPWTAPDLRAPAMTNHLSGERPAARTSGPAAGGAELIGGGSALGQVRQGPR